MALLQARGFSGFSDSFAIPSGSSDVICIGSVGLILSVGITQQVFGTLFIALGFTHFMGQQSLYSTT